MNPIESHKREKVLKTYVVINQMTKTTNYIPFLLNA